MMFGVLYIHHSLGFKQHPNWKIMVPNYLGGGNSVFFIFIPKIGGFMIPNLTISYFSDGVGEKSTTQL